MKKKYGFMYVVICLILLWFFPQSVQADEYPVSRALIIGRGEYGASNTLSPGPENDAKNFKRILLQAYGSDVVITEKEKEGVTTVSGVTNAIVEAFADSTEDTINYFYYVGHGTASGLYLGSETMTATGLAQAFSQIPGTHILVIDSCYSGVLISRSSSTDTETDFADTFIEEFSEAVASLKRNRSALNSADFHVITAASQEEESWQASLGENSAMIGLFTSNLVYGCGIDGRKVESDSDYSLGVAPADYDQDGKISFDEIYQFIQNQNYSSNVRKYPEYDETTFLPADQLASAAVTISKAEISYDAAGNPLLQLTHQTQQNAELQYAYYSGSLWSLTTLMRYCYTSSFVRTTSPVYQASGSYQISAGEGTSEIALSEGGVSLSEGNYAILIRAKGETYSYLLPFDVSQNQDSSLLQNFQVSGAESFTADGIAEYCITADFGTSTSETSTRPYVSCEIQNEDGETVRTLEQNKLVEVIEKSSTFYQYYKKFYWDGTDDNQNIVSAGEYQVNVTASQGGQEQTAAIWVRVEEPVEETKTETETESKTESETENGTETGSGTGTGTGTDTGTGSGTKTAVKETVKNKDASGSNSQSVNKEIAVSSITLKVNGKKLSKKKIVIGKKETVTLKPVISPSNASKKTVTYKSSHKKIVSVTAKGVVKGKKTGTAKITATTANGKKYTITVKVKKAPKKVTLTKTKKTLKKNQKYKIKVKLPKKTASYKITFKSSKKKVATVSATGVVTAKKKGTAVITVKTYNGNKARIKITVK